MAATWRSGGTKRRMPRGFAEPDRKSRKGLFDPRLKKNKFMNL
jgi:hypothetical protein